MDEGGSVEGQLNLGPAPAPRRSRERRGRCEDLAPRERLRCDQARYGDQTIERLVFGGFTNDDGHFVEVHGGSYLDSRAETERTGNIEAEGWLEVLDCERALIALRGVDPEAAMAVQCMMLGWDLDELQEAFRTMARDDHSSARAEKRTGLAIESGRKYMAAWLSGRDALRAYKAVRREWGRTRR